MVDDVKKLRVSFYCTESGNEPVREWLKALPVDDRRKIGEDIKTVEFGFPIGMPLVRPMGDGIFEVRTNLDGRIARVLFAIEDGEMILLHGFIKKTKKTPDYDLKLAKKRKKDLTK